MRQLFFLLLLVVGSAACAPAPSPSPASPPTPTTAGVAELLEAPPVGEVAIAGYLLVRPNGALLTDQVRFDGIVPVIPVGSPNLIWIGDPALPPDAQLQQADDLRYALAVVRGLLEGPGAFGPAGDLAYRINAPQVRLLSLRDLTIPLLLSNSGLYEGQAVQVRAQILISSSSALLVEELGQGGVPMAGALQIKLVSPPDDPELTARLSAASGGSVHYGPVQVVGIWRRGALYPLAITP